MLWMIGSNVAGRGGLGDAPDQRCRMGEAGRTLVRSRYSLDRVEFEYHRLYSSLVSGEIAGPAAESKGGAEKCSASG